MNLLHYPNCLLEDAIQDDGKTKMGLRASGLDYTIVRPGGLKSTPPSGNLVVNREDTTNGAEISRDLVADVCIASLFDGKASNKVVEIIEGEGTANLPKSEWFAKLA